VQSFSSVQRARRPVRRLPATWQSSGDVRVRSQSEGRCIGLEEWYPIWHLCLFSRTEMSLHVGAQSKLPGGISGATILYRAMSTSCEAYDHSMSY
jgi:hypothetical protein